MKPTTIALTAAFGLALVLSAPGKEPVPNPLTPAGKDAGWALLFDGKTLAGWNNWKTKKPLEEGGWKVVDGTLALVAPGAGDLYTSVAYESYELSLEWKTEGNSGILLRVDPAQGGPVYKVAPEMQADRKAGTSVHSPGALFDIFGMDSAPKVHADGWNEVRILVEGDTFTHWLNGTKLYSYTIGSEDWKRRIAGSKWKNTKGYGETRKGHIGLQDHGAKVAYRNLKIRVIGE